MAYTKAEAQEFLGRKVRVTFRGKKLPGGEAEEREGHIEEVALALYAEGRLEFLPVYLMDGEVLRVEYRYAKDIRCLVAYPTDLAQFEEEATPGGVEELISSIESTHPQTPPTITPVPVQKHQPE